MSSTFQERLRAYCELVRIPAVFTAPGDVVMGCFLVALWTEVEWFAYVALVVSSVFVYCAGMALNDVQDVEIDRIERPERPIPSGRISLRSAWVAVFAMQFSALAWAASVSPLSVGVVALTIALTYLYNSPLKDTWIGPILMGSCRYSNVFIGVSALGSRSLPSEAWIVVACIPLFNLIYVFGLTHLARHEVHGADEECCLRRG